jgi:hypothetical protein
MSERAAELDPLHWPAAVARAQALRGVGREEEAQQAYDDYLARWPEVSPIVNDAIVQAAERQDWDRFDTIVARAGERGFDNPRLRGLIGYYQQLRHPDPAHVAERLDAVRQELARTGTVPINQFLALHSLGAEEEAFALVDQASFAHMFEPDGPPPAGGYTPAIIWLPLYEPMRRDPRFVDFCAKLGLCDYWTKSSHWPDCADPDVLPYDFKAECQRQATA